MVAHTLRLLLTKNNWWDEIHGLTAFNQLLSNSKKGLDKIG